MNGSKIGLVLVFASFMGSLAPNVALAQENDGTEAEESGVDLFDGDVEKTRTGWSLLNVTGGYAYLDADGVLGVRPPNQPPITIINFDTVGLDETDSTHWLSLTWRSQASRWGAWIANWRYDVTGFRTWETEWEIDPGVVIPVGAGVRTTFDANWYIAELTYSFVQNETLDAGIGFGLHAVDLETDLEARIEVGEVQVEAVYGDLNTLAPLPNVLAYAYWDIHPRWNLVTRLGWFGLSYDKYDGRMLNLHALLRYEMSERWAVEGGYQFVKLDLDINEDNYTAIYDIDFYGPMLSLRFDF